MEAVEELAATGFTGEHFLAGLGIQGLAGEATRAIAAAPADRDTGAALVRHLDEPARRLGGVALQILLGLAQGQRDIQRACGHFRLAPAGDLGLEVGHGPGEKNREQQPAENQPGPGVQPGHRLAEALFHGIAIQYVTPLITPSTRLGNRMPAQARQALWVAKAQMNAPR